MLTGILTEWVRGTKARHRSSQEIYPIAFVKLVLANRPRYGGYIVHLAVIMVAFGVIGSSFFELQRDVVLAPGETYEIDNYKIKYIETNPIVKSDRTEFISAIEVDRNGEYLTTITAKRSFYPSFNMASTLAGIRSTPVEDLYIVPSENLPDGSVGFRILINPLMWWMWVGGPVMILGTVIALWPQQIRQNTMRANQSG